MNPFETEIKGKKVLVFGVGRQGGGTGDAKWLAEHGALVRLSDRDLTIVKEGQTQEQIDWADLIIKNPGVPDDHPLILSAKAQSKPIYTSVALFVKYTEVKTIGVTGTRGKSTTVALITKILENAFPGQVISGGNIAGTSCLELFNQQPGKRFAVLELSSFQLHNFHDLQISPNLSVITNLYPDHLNRYPNMASYQADKEAICKYQKESDLCLYNSDNPGSFAIASISKAKKISYTSDLVEGWQTQLPGLHNLENIAAAWSTVQSLGVSEDQARTVVKDFTGVPYRQEKIATIAGITYINDTTATTPTASIKALQAASGPTIWITGGDTKNLPYDQLLAVARQNNFLKGVVVLGSKNIPDYVRQLQALLGSKIIGTASTMSEAVDLARSHSVSGDAILLSPGFASFDLFENEFDRGRQFNDYVHLIATA